MSGLAGDGMRHPAHDPGVQLRVGMMVERQPPERRAQRPRMEQGERDEHGEYRAGLGPDAAHVIQNCRPKPSCRPHYRRQNCYLRRDLVKFPPHGSGYLRRGISAVFLGQPGKVISARRDHLVMIESGFYRERDAQGGVYFDYRVCSAVRGWRSHLIRSTGVYEGAR
jgi:hypothetical protein